MSCPRGTEFMSNHQAGHPPMQSPRTRREILGWTVAAGAVVLLNPSLPFAIAKEPKKDADLPVPGKAAAKRLILLYMAGGASQFETWAPKKKGTPNIGE